MFNKKGEGTVSHTREFKYSTVHINSYVHARTRGKTWKYLAQAARLSGQQVLSPTVLHGIRGTWPNILG